jgi:high-affinity gluconate transporter
MISVTIANLWLVKGTPVHTVLNFLGSSQIAMFIAMLAAFFFFGSQRGHPMDWVMHSFEGAVRGIAMVVLIIGAGGALKQVIIDTGIGNTIGSLMSSGGISPYVMAWLITVLIRLATGQGVVSAMTAAGIIGAALINPATHTVTAANPALLVLATAAGANTLTHINDASFWLFKGYFDLSVKDTLKTWGLLELTNSVVGLGAVMLISIFA